LAMIVSGSLVQVKRGAAVVPGVDEPLNCGVQAGHGGVVAAARGLAGDDREERLDLVQPGAEVGVKCRRTRGWRVSQARTAECLSVA
jgi:hypothetical protein